MLIATDCPSKSTDVIVLGAGIVGVSSALATRELGLSVVLIDRRMPGSETSYGNAGILSSGAIFPFNKPALLAALPRYLANASTALRWDPAWAIRNAGWLARFLANAMPQFVEPRAVALRGLVEASLKFHRAWIRRANAGHRLRETGWLKASRGSSLAAAQAEQRALKNFGVASEVLDRDAIRTLEPDIVPIYRSGLLLTGTASVDSPSAVVRAYSRMYEEVGGQFLQADIKTIEPTAEGWCVRLEGSMLHGRHLVVALGPWSAELLRPLGYRVLLAFERGYHQEFRKNPSRRFSRPILDLDGNFTVTPLEGGIRVTSGVELTARDAPSCLRQIESVVPLARAAVEFGDAIGPVWRGARPTLPDGLPMIGAAPRHQGLWLAFGHQHIGFTTGPATGAAIAAAIGGLTPPFDARAFAPVRYL